MFVRFLKLFKFDSMGQFGNYCNVKLEPTQYLSSTGSHYDPKTYLEFHPLKFITYGTIFKYDFFGLNITRFFHAVLPRLSVS